MGNMDNIVPKGAELVFAGKKRKMVFINKAIKYLKEKYCGFKKAIEKIDDDNGDIDYDVFADILYAGFMVNKDDSLTVDFIKAELDELSIFETREIATTHLVAALTGTYPAAKEGNENPQ